MSLSLADEDSIGGGVGMNLSLSSCSQMNLLRASSKFSKQSYTSSISFLEVLREQEQIFLPKQKGRRPSDALQLNQQLAALQEEESTTSQPNSPTNSLKIDDLQQFSRERLLALQKESSRLLEIQTVQVESSTVEMAFLHASPNILKDFDMDRQKLGSISLPPEALDFLKEQDSIKQTLIDSGKKITFKASVANKVAFQNTITDAPQVLHISCHGTTMANKQYLIFENDYGGGDMVSEDELKNLMDSRKNADLKIQLIFIAACTSEKIGELFQKYGVEHIICVKDKRNVLDDVVIKFTQTFYKAVFTGKPVCEAFNTAVHATQFKLEEGKSNEVCFKLLRGSDKQNEFDPYSHGIPPHDCRPLPLASRGMWQCMSEHNLTKWIPNRLQLKFRERETSTILQAFLMQKQRILSLCGLQGIGKSSLARDTMNYARERKMFLGGKLFIQCKESNTCSNLLKLILRVIFKIIDMSTEARNRLVKDLCADEQLKEYIKDFFRGRCKEPLKKKKYSSEKKEGNLFLLCLDNIEHLMQNDDENEEFSHFLSDLLDECSDLCILVTSADTLCTLPNGIEPEVQWVRPLRNASAAKLFFDRCGPFDEQEFVQWILKDKKYPFQKLITRSQDKEILQLLQLSKEQEITAEQTERVESEIRRKIFYFRSGLNNGQIEWMQHHDMFQQMAGNPTSITMVSAACKNENFDLGPNKLIYMYDNIVQNNRILINEIGIGDGSGKGGRRLRQVQNHKISLEFSTHCSIQLLEQSSKDDVQVLYFLGCLPGGIREPQLRQMLDRQVKLTLEKLESLSFLENESATYQLTPFMISYIEKQQDSKFKLSSMETICEYYKEILRENYEVIGRVNDSLDETKQEGPEEPIQKCPRLKVIDSIEQKKQQALRFNSGNQAQDYLREQIGNEKDYLKTSVFGKMLQEITNINYVIKFFIEYASKHIDVRNSNIFFNQSFKKLLEVIPQEPNEGHSPTNVDGSVSSIDRALEKPQDNPSTQQSRQEADSNEGSGNNSVRSLSASSVNNNEPESGKYQFQANVREGFEKQMAVIKDSQKNKIKRQPQTLQMDAPINLKLSQKLGVNKLSLTTKIVIPKSRSQARNQPQLKNHMSSTIVQGKKLEQISFVGKPQLKNHMSSTFIKGEKLEQISEASERASERKQEEVKQDQSQETSSDAESQCIGSQSSDEDCESPEVQNQVDDTSLSDQPQKAKSAFVDPKKQSALMIKDKQTKGRPASPQRKNPYAMNQTQKCQPSKFYTPCKDEHADNKRECESAHAYGRDELLEEDVFKGKLDLGIGERRLSDDSQAYSSDISSDCSISDNSSQAYRQQCSLPLVSNLEDFNEVSKVVPPLNRKTSEDQSNSSNLTQKDLFVSQNQPYVKRNSATMLESGLDSMLQQLTGSPHIINRRATMDSSKSRMEHKSFKNKERREEELKLAKELDLKFQQCPLSNSIRMPDAIFLPKKLDNQPPRLGHSQSLQEQDLRLALKVWKPMSSNEEFIVLIMADTFLTHDYEGVLRIAKNDYSYVANSPLFEANLCRFLSLASFKAFDHAMHAGESAREANLGLLIQALQSAQCALNIYSSPQDGMSSMDQNPYGMALSNFTIGYIYDLFAEYLHDSHQSDPEFDFIQVNKQMCKNKAHDCYKDAYGSFKKVGHIMGTYQSKLGELDTYAVDSDDEDDDLELQQLKQQVADEKCKLQNFENEIGFEHSCYIPREHGQEISLMAEIVLQQEIMPLFNENPAIKRKSTIQRQGFVRRTTQENLLSVVKAQSQFSIQLQKTPSINSSEDSVTEKSFQTLHGIKHKRFGSR